MNSVNDEIQSIWNIATVGECQYLCQQHSSCFYFKYHYLALGSEWAEVCALYSAHPGKHARNHISVGPKYC